MLSSTEYDFCDSKQELDYILNTVNTICHISNDNNKELKQVNDRLIALEQKLNTIPVNKDELYYRNKDIIFLAIFATFLISMF